MRRESQPEQRAILGIGEAEYANGSAAGKPELTRQLRFRERISERTLIEPDNELHRIERRNNTRCLECHLGCPGNLRNGKKQSEHAATLPHLMRHTQKYKCRANCMVRGSRAELI